MLYRTGTIRGEFLKLELSVCNAAENRKVFSDCDKNGVPSSKLSIEEFEFETLL